MNIIFLSSLILVGCSEDAAETKTPQNEAFIANNDFNSKESSVSGSFELTSAQGTTATTLTWGGATAQYKGLILTLVPKDYSGSINLLKGCSECMQIYISALNINSTDYVYSHKAPTRNDFSPAQFTFADFDFMDGSMESLSEHQIAIKYKDYTVQTSQGNINISNFNYVRTGEYAAHLALDLSIEQLALKNANNEDFTLNASVHFVGDDATPPIDDPSGGGTGECSTYSSSITDPQIKPLCQAAWSYSCSGDTELVKQSCATLQGWGEKSNCSYCQGY